MFFLAGVAQYLFVPLAEAVVFAMLASYLLSRTLVPTMARYLLLAQTEEERSEQARSLANPFVRLQLAFEARIRTSPRPLPSTCSTLHSPPQASSRSAFWPLAFFPLRCCLSWGRIFSRRVDSGEFKLHMRAPTGTRIEETAAICDRVEAISASEIPPSELAGIIDNIGLPYSSINLSYSTSAPVGTGDADIQVELEPKSTVPPTSTFATCA